jgi:hypothetical protein
MRSRDEMAIVKWRGRLHVAGFFSAGIAQADAIQSATTEEAIPVV